MRILEDELLRKSGIYKIVNLVNNNTYIGSAVKLYKRKTSKGFIYKYKTNG